MTKAEAQTEWPVPSLVEGGPAVASPLTPMDLMQRALEAGNLELVERMMTLQERWEANQARKAFDAAIAAAGAEMPVIIKNREVQFTGRGYRYEDFPAVARAVDPVLARHGLRYRFRTVSQEKTLTVTCILSHRDGHFEENTLTAPIDVGQNRNALQAIGSSQTYLQRYTLKAALGLASSQDDDASSVTPLPESVAAADTGELISHEQIQTLLAALKVSETPKERLLKWIRTAYRGGSEIADIGDIPAHIFQTCLDKVRKSGDPQ